MAILILGAGSGVEEGEVDFQPRVLVAADDDAGAILIEEENRRVWGRGLEQVVFDREIEVWVVGGGDVGFYGRWRAT